MFCSLSKGNVVRDEVGELNKDLNKKIVYCFVFC